MSDRVFKSTHPFKYSDLKGPGIFDKLSLHLQEISLKHPKGCTSFDFFVDPNDDVVWLVCSCDNNDEETIKRHEEMRDQIRVHVKLCMNAEGRRNSDTGLPDLGDPFEKLSGDFSATMNDIMKKCRLNAVLVFNVARAAK